MPVFFDNTAIESLRKKYKNTPSMYLPKVLKIDQFPEAVGEKEYIEELVSTVPSNIQKKWLGDFLTNDNSKFMGAWFEIMLYGWLSEYFEVVVEPEVENNKPDFCIKVGDKSYFIEARAIVKNEEERNREAFISQIISILETIELSYMVDIDKDSLIFSKPLDEYHFKNKVQIWLESYPYENLLYKDSFGNEINLTAERLHDYSFVVASSGEAGWIDHSPMVNPIRKKATQHKQIRKSGKPYIIAIFLEPFLLSARGVVRTWFGNQQYIFDKRTLELVKTEIDQTGIQFFGNEIRHRSVSGTLVFKADYNYVEKRRILNSWYVQNPYANVPISDTLFPAGEKFIVVNEKGDSLSMTWLKNSI